MSDIRVLGGIVIALLLALGAIAWLYVAQWLGWVFLALAAVALIVLGIAIGVLSAASDSAGRGGNTG